MHRVLISLGSNCQQSVHIQWTSERLCTVLQDVSFSRKLWTADIKGSGHWYMNRLLKGHTTLTASELEVLLKQLERETGRDKGRVTIDADLLLYDKERFHMHDWPRTYVQQLLPDVMDEKSLSQLIKNK